MKDRNYIHIFSIIGLAFLWFSTAVWLYWQFLDPNVISFKNPYTVLVDKTEYSPGDRIVYTLEYCKTRRLVGTVNRALQDTYRITYATIYSDLPVGCNIVKVNDLVVPDFVQGDGKTYHLELFGEYKINPIRTQTVFLRTIDFLIR